MKHNSLSIVSVISKITRKTSFIKPKEEDKTLKKTLNLMEKFKSLKIIFNYDPNKPIQKFFTIERYDGINDNFTSGWIISYGSSEKVIITKCGYIPTKYIKEVNIIKTIKKVKTFKPLARKLRWFHKQFVSIKKHSDEFLNKYEELKSKYERLRLIYGYNCGDFNEEQRKLYMLYMEERTYEYCMQKINSMRQRKQKVLLD